MTDLDRILAFGQHLADVADEISVSLFRRNPPTRHKHDGTLVTEADEAIERAVRSELAIAYPDHSILGEEEGGSGAEPGRPRWIIDPIDGTINFSSGVPIWATLIAHEVDGEIVAGVVSAPALAERYHAVRGGGSFRNGEPIRVSGVSDLNEAYLAYGTYSHWERYGRLAGFVRLASTVRTSRGLGDFWGHMLVATGAVDVMCEPVVAVWDLAALIVIVEEAGGRFTDLDGKRGISGGSAVSTNGLLHEAVTRHFA